jgi:hypothetical protein
MNVLIKLLLVLFLIGWSWLGLWLVLRYARLFGPHPDDPSESPGARSFGVAHIAIVWIGFFALGLYFLFFR